MSDLSSRQSTPVPLDQPPEVISVGHGVHGHRRREHWLLPELYALHIYDWTGELKIGDTLHQIRPGDLSIIGPGTAMEYRYTGPSHHLYAHLRLPRTGAYTEISSVQPLGAELPVLRARLDTASTSDEPAQRVAEVWSVLWAAAIRTSRPDADQPHPAVRSAVLYIDRNLSESLRVKEIARIALVSVSHLNRLFTAAYHTGVSGYIRDRRIQRAHHLLQDTTQPISSVAAGVGIPDLQAFNKFCRAHLGASPREVRSGR